MHRSGTVLRLRPQSLDSDRNLFTGLGDAGGDSHLMEVAVEEFFDFWPFEGDRLELSFVVVVEERQSLPSICGRTHMIGECWALVSPQTPRRCFAATLTVQDDSHQRLVVLVEDLPEGEGLLRSVGQQSEQQSDGVVGGQPFRMHEPAERDKSVKPRPRSSSHTNTLTHGTWSAVPGEHRCAGGNRGRC